MRAAAIGLGALSALLGLIIGLQMSELSSLREETTSLRRDLSECRIAASRTPASPQAQPVTDRGVKPTPRPQTIDREPSGTTDVSAEAQLQRAFDEAATRPPLPHEPPVRSHTAFRRPDSVAEARAQFEEEFASWAAGANVSAAEVRLFEDSINPLFDTLAELEAQVDAGDLDLQDASREAGQIRSDMIAELRQEAGDEVFRDMWRTTGVGKLLQLHTPR